MAVAVVPGVAVGVMSPVRVAIRDRDGLRLQDSEGEGREGVSVGTCESERVAAMDGEGVAGAVAVRV